jgi:hypothetical protein
MLRVMMQALKESVGPRKGVLNGVLESRNIVWDGMFLRGKRV